MQHSNLEQQQSILVKLSLYTYIINFVNKKYNTTQDKGPPDNFVPKIIDPPPPPPIPRLWIFNLCIYDMHLITVFTALLCYYVCLSNNLVQKHLPLPAIFGLSICLFVCLSVHLVVYLSICLTICLSNNLVRMHLPLPAILVHQHDQPYSPLSIHKIHERPLQHF